MELNVSAASLDANAAAAGIDLVVPWQPQDDADDDDSATSGDSGDAAVGQRTLRGFQAFQARGLKLLGFGPDGCGMVSIAIGRAQDAIPMPPPQRAGSVLVTGSSSGPVKDDDSQEGWCGADPVLIAAARLLAATAMKDLPAPARALLAPPPAAGGGDGSHAASAKEAAEARALLLESLGRIAPGPSPSSGGTGGLLRGDREAAALVACAVTCAGAARAFPTTLPQDDALLRLHATAAASSPGSSAASPLTANGAAAVSLRAEKRRCLELATAALVAAARRATAKQ